MVDTMKLIILTDHWIWYSISLNDAWISFDADSILAFHFPLQFQCCCSRVWQFNKIDVLPIEMVFFSASTNDVVYDLHAIKFEYI